MNARRMHLVDYIAVVVCLVSAWNPLHSEDRSSASIISRGYVGAPNGTVLLAGDPVGGNKILEMHMQPGQTVKRDQILVVLSSYPRSEINIRSWEMNIESMKITRESLLTGPNAMDEAIQERNIEIKIVSNKLAALQRKRSATPPDQKQIEANLDELRLDNMKTSLQLQKDAVANALRTIEMEIANGEANLALARSYLESALVRSPLDGVIIEIFARTGERVPTPIAKIVDMRQLRVLADVDELRVGSLKLGGKAQVTFYGDATVHKGKISNIAPAVKRMQLGGQSIASASDGRIVLVEVELDDTSSMPQVLGREARIMFLLDS